MIDLRVQADLNVHPFGQRIDHRGTDSVKPS